MSKARTLANLISDNAELADGQISVAEVVGAAPLASPTFTGTVTSTGNIALGDDDELVLGSNRMRLYYSASNNYTVLDSNGTSGFVFDGVNNLSVNIGGSLSGAFTANGVSLYSGGTEKLQVYGSGTIALDDIKVNDDVKIGFGQFHTDLELYHDSATTTNKLVGDLTQTGAFTTDKYNNAEALPTVRPSLLLDFANSKTLDPRITFTRGSTATYWDGKTTTKAEENLITYSQELRDATYTNGGVVFTENDTTAPDGTTTADKVTFTSQTTSRFYKIVPNSTGGYLTFSFYAKYVDKQWISVRITESAAGTAGIYLRTWFDLSNGVVGTDETNDATITSVGNGWYRCTVTSQHQVANDAFLIRGAAADNATSNVAAAGDVYFWGLQAEQRSSATAYTATTSSPIVKYQPVLQTAASGEARFDHDPVTGESKGLLIEEARTNLENNSTGGVSYVGAGSSLTTNYTIAPDGTNTASYLKAATATGTKVFDHYGQTASTTPHTFSVFIKAYGYNRVGLEYLASGGFAASSRFNLTDGTVYQNSSGATGHIQEIGNGWYRIAVTCTPTSTASDIQRIFIIDNSGNSSFAGDGFSGLLAWGYQNETGSFPTSYIPTSGSTVTRSADLAKIVGTAFTDAVPAEEVAGFCSLVDLKLSGIRTPYQLGSQSADRHGPFFSSAVVNYYDGIVQQVGTANSDGTNIQAVNMFYNDVAMSFDGGAAAALSNRSIETGATTLTIGCSYNQSEYLCASIKKLALYPKKLSNATLQAMTEE